ncbi:MAG: hypothetical protein J3T61_09380, partial [Candidatus Brocadiales bacterium]|nr:hypothetical protein [Candidatus Bathyanammoxibius sp.]
MVWKARFKQLVPVPLYNKLLLSFPFLYRTRLICYESNLQGGPAISELLSCLDNALHLQGNIIECGSSRCGTAIIMADHLGKRGYQKLVYACDSFEGFNRAELEVEVSQHRFPPEAGTWFTSTSFEYVTRKIAVLGFNGAVVPIKGYFHDTLAKIDSSYCFAFIDCDLRESARYCASVLWPRLVSSGI